MSGKQEPKDWTRVARIIEQDRHAAEPRSPIEISINDAPIGGEANGATSNGLVPQFGEVDGIVAAYRARKIRQESALAAVQKVFEGQLDILDHYVKSQVLARKRGIDLEVKEFLAKQDARHLELLGEFDVKHVEIRTRTLVDLTTRYVALVSELEGKDWPEPLIEETIGQVSSLRRRVSAQIMEQFPSKYENSDR